MYIQSLYSHLVQPFVFEITTKGLNTLRRVAVITVWGNIGKKRPTLWFKHLVLYHNRETSLHFSAQTSSGDAGTKRTGLNTRPTPTAGRQTVDRPPSQTVFGMRPRKHLDIARLRVRPADHHSFTFSRTSTVTFGKPQCSERPSLVTLEPTSRQRHRPVRD